jgi:preprotein translocase subunit SecE
MGRIQRKKASRKKKKQSENLSAASQVKDDAVEKKAALSSVSAKEVTRRQILPQKNQDSVAKVAAVKPGKNFLDKGLQFLREVKIELKKVTWPTRKQTIGSTAVVIILVMIISFFLGIVDIGLSSLVRVVLQ